MYVRQVEVVEVAVRWIRGLGSTALLLAKVDLDEDSSGRGGRRRVWMEGGWMKGGVVGSMEVWWW